MRFKYRYLLCRVSFADAAVDAGLNSGFLFRSIQAHVESQWGDYGAGAVAASLAVKYYNPLTGLAIVRAARQHYKFVWTALSSLSKLKGRVCSVDITHTAGTIRACQKETLLQNRAALLALDAERAQPPAVVNVHAKTGVSANSTASASTSTSTSNEPAAMLRVATVTLTAVESATGELAQFRSQALAQQLQATESEIAALDHAAT